MHVESCCSRDWSAWLQEVNKQFNLCAPGVCKPWRWYLSQWVPGGNAQGEMADKELLMHR